MRTPALPPIVRACSAPQSGLAGWGLCLGGCSWGSQCQTWRCQNGHAPTSCYRPDGLRRIKQKERLRLGFVGLLPVLKRLRAGLNPFEIGVDAVGASRVRGAADGSFLTTRKLLGPAFLLLALALTFLL